MYWKTIWADLSAGFQVALLTIPQAIAYALVAGLPVECGLIAAMFPSMVAALLGSSRFLVAGPANAVALLLQAGTVQILYTHYNEAAPAELERLARDITVHIALIAGLFQLGIGLLKWGRLTQFVSHSVLTGYLTGGALALAASQLFRLTGMRLPRDAYSLYDQVSYWATHLDKTDLATLAVGGSGICIFLFFRSLNAKIPAAALMLAIVAGSCVLIRLSPFASSLQSVVLVGQEAMWPDFVPVWNWPILSGELVNQLLSVSFAVALLSTIETSCTVKAMAATFGDRASINQELVALGSANLVSACVGAMPVSVTGSRSQFNVQMGAKSRLSAISSACFVVVIVGYLGSFVGAIPMAALAALLLVTSFGLLRPQQLQLCLKATRGDAAVLVATLLACIFFSLDTAFYVGVMLSIAFYLQKAAEPHLTEYAVGDQGNLMSLDRSQAYLSKAIRVIKVEGELFFGSAEVFYTTLRSIAEDDHTTRVLLLQLKNARDMDGSSCWALMQLHEYLTRGHRHLVLCGMDEEAWEVMSNTGLIAQIGKSNLFLFDPHHPHAHMQRAMARAKILADQIDLQTTMTWVDNDAIDPGVAVFSQKPVHSKQPPA